MESRIPREVGEALHRGATVVTPHERAARAVRSAWDLEQRSAGQSSWATPKALSWRTWTAELWHLVQLDGATELILLNPTQERRLWTSVLEQLPEQRSPAALWALAARCIDAHRRLEAYVGESRNRATRNAAGRPFSDWLRQVQERCQHSRFLPSAELDRALARSISSRSLSLLPSSDMVLFGFDELPPAQEALCTAWQQVGGCCRRVTIESVGPIGGTIAAQTEEDEVRQFALWATTRLSDPACERVALVVRDLDQQRDEVDATLRDALSSATLDRSQLTWPEQPIFEFSLGRSLDSEPLIQTALDLVRWTQAPLPLPSITRLLLSPYFACSQSYRGELDMRTQVDRRLRRGFRLRPEASVADVLAVCGELHGSSPVRIRQGLETLLHSSLAQSAGHSEGEIRPASSWVAAIRSALADVWGGHSSSSYNFQLRTRWEDLLDEVGTLDLLDPGYTFSRFFTLLERQAREVVFAPESRDAPVQILGPVEAAGQRFDALWVMGCSHLRWPPERATNSLLSLDLQRDAGAPGADRQRERHWAGLLTSRLAFSAPDVVFSYARQSHDAADQQLSPLVQALHLPFLPAAPEVVSANTQVALERLVDASPIAALASTAVQGGARLLQLQAACGFRAFAELRLRAEEVDHRLLGMDARERGTATHAALDAIWRELKSQERLLSLSPAERDRALSEAVEHGLRTATAGAHKDRWGTQYLDVQRVRLRRVLEVWLEKESTRPPFDVVGSEITLDHVPVGPLHLSVRIDRLDLVESHHVLLDYKTSKTSAAAWHGERPDQPQMLLYAMLAAAGHLATLPDAPRYPLGALAFANIISGSEMGLSGVQQDGSALIPLSNRRPNRDMEEQLARWTAVIHRLASAFAAGEAQVDPANYPVICQHCSQRLLCRLAPEMLLEAEAASSDHGMQDG